MAPPPGSSVARASNGRRAPGPAGHPLLGALSSMRRDPIRTLLDAWRAHVDFVHIPMPATQVFLAVHPDHVHQVLQENAANYGKQTIGYQKMRLALGHGLLTSEGRQRRIAQPAFHRQRHAQAPAADTKRQEA